MQSTYINSALTGSPHGRTYWRPARNPRAGVAIGAAILVAWLGALGVAIASDESVNENHESAPAGHVQAAPER
jgi:hypothetical protein